MKTLNLSKAQLDENYPQAKTYEELFRLIERDRSLAGEVVCSYKINGVKLDEAAENNISLSSIDEVTEIEVQTDEVGNLIFEVVHNWIAVLPQMIEKVDELAKNIKLNGVTGQLQPLVKTIDECQLLVDSVLSVSSVLQSHPMIQSEDWAKAETQTASTIGQCLQSFQDRDFVVLCDILEYDLADSLMSWQNNFKKLDESIRTSMATELRQADATQPEEISVMDGGISSS